MEAMPQENFVQDTAHTATLTFLSFYVQKSALKCPYIKEI